MIVGLGEDMVDIKRIEKALNRHGPRFLQRCFTREEREDASRRRAAGPQAEAATLAKRFAAKEACAKAFGTGFRNGLKLKDIGVTNDAHGKPSLVLQGVAQQRLEDMSPNGSEMRLHLTLTDEYPLAKALVIIEAV